MARLLLVEDDELLGDGISKVLMRRGDEIEWVKDGKAAMNATLVGHYDLILLDLNLPKVSGFELLQRLRSSGNSIPVLVLTARDDVADRVRALDGGADDYLIKPVDLDELGARIRALQRRSQGRAENRLEHGDLQLDVLTREVRVGGEAVTLSVREFTVLQILLENQGRVMSRKQLEQKLYGWDDGVSSNSIEVHVHNLRRKLARDPIRTVRGVGYLIEKSKQ